MGTDREEPGELSRQRILDAAVRLMSARGYDGTSIAAIVGEAGLPASSIYWHFGSKEGVLLAAIERERLSLPEREALPPADGLSPRAEFARRQRQILRGELDKASFPRLALMLLLDYGGAPPAIRESLDTLTEAGRDRITEELRDAFADLGAGAAAQMAEELLDITWATTIGLQLSSMLSPDEWPDSRVEATFLALLELGEPT